MQNKVIKVRGSASVFQEPDWVENRFTLIGKAWDDSEAMEELSERTESLRRDMEEANIDREQLKTGSFSVSPHFDWENKRRIFQGYTAEHTVNLEFTMDKELLNRVLDKLGHSQSKAKFEIRFTVKDPEPMKQEALSKAVKNAQEKARVIAEAAGVQLGDLLQGDYSWEEIHLFSPTSVEIREEASMAADLSPKDVEHGDSVTLVWEIK